ncbi:Tethering factor for nuclear proteasome sts1 [Zalaria obscura]|uniref:Tethering factor for nuclear proteasome sts1 n=1 Tax=Zalaria obscura TaxID=2024903 RepID=A0ACC3SEH1_9PEZI
MNSVIPNNPLFAPHLLGNSRLSPSHSDNYTPERMSGRKRKVDDDFTDRDNDERMSTSPSPAFANRGLPQATTPRSIKRTRTNVSGGRPLALPRLLETLSADDMRNLLQTICDHNPSIAHEVVTKAPRPSIDATMSVLSRYETSLKEAFPYGNRPTSDYTYNRVRQPMLQLLDALKDFTPHYLPPNEPHLTVSLTYLDAVTNIIHRIPNWDTYQHNRPKQEAYDEIAKAWALVVQEGSKKGGGFHLQFGGWDQKLLKHNQESGGRMEEAVEQLRAVTPGIQSPGSSTSSPGPGNDERARIRQQILSGTYGQDLSVGVGQW